MRRRTAIMPGMLLGIVVAGPDAGAQEAPSKSCVDVQIGSDRSYACLSQALRETVQRTPRPLAMPDIGVTSPAPSVGTFNEAGTKERMGDAFGKSVVPQRPPAPVYPNPLIRPGAR